MTAGKLCQRGFERNGGLLGTEAVFSGPEFTFGVDVSFASVPAGIAIMPRAARFTAYAIQYVVAPRGVGAAIAQFSGGVFVGYEAVALGSIPARVGLLVTPLAVSLLADDAVALSVPNLVRDVTGGIFFGAGGGVGGFPICFDNVLLTVSGEVQPIEVSIDIKPGSDPNSINPNSKGVVPVAILTTEGFDAANVDPARAGFAGASPVHSALEDVDGDGDLDMILHFRVQDANLGTTDTAACLTAETDGGTPIRGCDSVNLVP